ncbi:MAG: flagellar hook capping FlgD N-terminal domain-containing protein [Pseudomonadota bacterium]
MDAISSFEDIFPQRATESGRGGNSVEDLGSEDFLALMVAQLENQDPTSPMDNTDFIAQLAQFGSVSGIQELNDGFGELSASLTGNQALEAASLVGRSVVTDSNLGELRQVGVAEGEPVYALDATVDFGGSAGGGTLYVQDEAGRLVYSSPLPPSDGDMKISWDGRNADGIVMPPGRYRVSAEAFIGTETQSVSVHAHQPVQSVAVDGITGRVTLELSSGEDISLDEVKAFL